MDIIEHFPHLFNSYFFKLSASKLITMLKYFFLRVNLAAFFILISIGISFSQKTDPNELRFKNAKELMSLEKYSLAMQTFKPLISSLEGNQYAAISSYYYAISAYNDNHKYVARDMFLQILSEYPNWEKQDEVYLWLTNIYLQEGDYKKGLTYASKIKNHEILSAASGLKKSFLQKLELSQLDSLLKEYPSDKTIAEGLAEKIFQQPIANQDRDLLENIVSVYNLDNNRYRIDENLKSVKKDKYQVAVMLPFMKDKIKNNPKHLSNEFVIELYEGILMGASDLKSKGINISLHLYDTKKDSATTAEILELDEIKHMDLIIGPLFPDPVKIVSNFSFINRINMINPLSGNSEIIGKNPYAFLFLPSGKTRARKAADYMASTIENKNVFVFHGTNARDSVMAYEYKKEIEKQGFTVCYIDGVAKEDAKNILDILTNTNTVEFDASEFDSLEIDLKIKGNLRITKKDYLAIQPDSIGHVFVASNDQALAANTITGLETRGDAIALLGFEEWLSQQVISLGGLDRLNAHLIAPTFIDKSNPKYESLNALFMEAFNAYPTRNFYIGYEVMITTGKMMNRMGSLFQFDRGIDEIIEGEIFQGALYGNKNSNQIVPIIKFRNSELVVVSPKN